VHNERRDVFDELEFCHLVNKVSPEDYRKGGAQLESYLAAGMPPDRRLTENGIILRRHGGPRLAAAMALWWDELKAHTRRDQLSLPYVLHASRIETKLFDWNYNDENPYFHRYFHRSRFLKNVYVAMHNKRFYNRVNFYVYGAVVNSYKTVLKRVLPGALLPKPRNRRER
jgi:hypothetical protein